jgi:hypothetical protein
MSILDTKAVDKPMNFQPALTLNDPHKITALPLFVLLERFMRWRASGMSGIPGVTTRIQILNITLPLRIADRTLFGPTCCFSHKVASSEIVLRKTASCWRTN